MGDNKLSLLLLLCTTVLTNAQDEETPCLLAKRYKSFHKYEYSYETESLNALNGATNGPKASCKVEIEVPGTCSYIVRTTSCTLSEVTNVDGEGKPVFGPSAGADTFRAAMEKNPLKFTVDEKNEIKLFPEDDEPINILNIKRGLISALAVPLLEEEQNKRMPTIYGLCKTGYSVNAREDIATDVTLNRDLSKCDNFRPIKDHTSPLALITGMHYPLTHLIRSSQICNYKFDNAQKHMTSGVCNENHILVPFSYKGQYGVTNVGKQSLTLVGVTTHNDRIFEHNVANMRTLHLDGSADTVHPIADKEDMLAVLRELTGLSGTKNGHKRAHLAHKLVSVVRKMNVEALTAGLPDALEISRPLMYQVLFQCGTPECSSAIMQVLRTFDSSSVEIDAAVYALGMVPNPSRALVKEMLEMAKFKASKPIYYALSNAVRRLYEAEGNVTPEIQAVADYALEQIGDCTGNPEQIYLSLRVIGNMAAAVGAASPALKSAITQCVNQPSATPEVQQAAIQAFRLTSVPEEGRKVFMQVLLDGAAPMQNRIAAYLILMKEPQPSELAQLIAALPNNGNVQVMSFVNSHLNNILSSKAPETRELREKILNALQGNEIVAVMDPTKYSRNYKIGSLEGNVIFESEDLVPNEVILDMTLNAFGYDIDMFEIGFNGKGLEPTIDALIGIDGFFRDTMQKTINYAADKMPKGNEILESMFPKLWNEIKMKQGPQSIIKEVTNNVNKLIQKLKAQENPEAMIYLRLLGAELGYLKTKDVEEMAYSAALLTNSLVKMFPTDFVKSLFSSANNDLFLHYIFMDNEFYLPTGSGVPLRIALSGTFAPGVKGGLKFGRDMSEIAFMPSAGIEFVTEVGALLPEYVQSGLEMHTNIYHESGMRAKVAVSNKQVKLTIPAPQDPTKIFSMTNSLVSVSGTETKTIPVLMDQVKMKECTPFIPGVNYCSDLQYSDAYSSDAAPYFPLTGDSKFSIELHPTGEVSEYTATLDYASEDKVDKVTFAVKAEGTSFEGTAKVMFDRQKYSVSSDFQVPDYDLEAGIRIGPVDPSTKGKATHSIQIDFINKKIPQASLIGLAKIEAMKDAMLVVQLLVPNLQTNAKVTANLNCVDGLTLELESDLKIPKTSSVQKVILKYDADKIEAEVKSDMSSEIDTIKAVVRDFLDQKVGQSEMTINDILIKSVEGTNGYLEQYAAGIPFIENLRVPAVSEFTLPEKLFLNAEGAAKYKFSQKYYTIHIPVPFGGKSSGDLNITATITTPDFEVPQLGLQVASASITLPEFFVPEKLPLTLPVLGMAEFSSKLNSNLYNMEATVSAGKEPENPTYSTKFEVTGSSPVDILSLKVEGSASLIDTPSDSFKVEVKTAVNHKLLDVSVSFLGDVKPAAKITVKSSSKIEATSPLGLKVSLEHTSQAGLNIKEISGDGNLVGSIVIGPLNVDATLKQSLVLHPFKPAGKIDSSLEVNSNLLSARNIFEVALDNGEFNVVSKTTAFEDSLTHNVEVTYKESLLAFKSNAKAFDLSIRNIAEASARSDRVNFKIEAAADRYEDLIESRFTADLDVNGFDVKNVASAKLAEYKASHNCSLSLNKDGLGMQGTTSLQSPLTFESNFNGTLDTSKLSLSTVTKGDFGEMTNSLSASLSSVAFTSKAEANVAHGTSYAHDISLQMEHNKALMNINNNLTVLHVSLINEAQMKAHPYKADLTGSLRLAYGEEELKHTYEIGYADLVTTAKCSVAGKLMGSHLIQNTEIDISGLALTVRNAARFNSQPIRFDNTFHVTALPFSLNVDAITNADSDVSLYGKHSTQVYSKFLLKAEPFAFAHSHECRLSTTQNLDNGVSIETNLDNKIDTLLTPSEQKATMRMESKVNCHVLTQDLRLYNTPERLGLEMSGSMITNLFNTVDSEKQDHFLSAFLKYDKNANSHVINLPLMEYIPRVLERIKLTVITVAESLQYHINSVDIQKLPDHLRDFMSDINLEERLNRMRQELISLNQKYGITQEELDASLDNLRTVVLKLFTNLGTYANEIAKMMKEVIALSDTAVLTETFNAFNEKYEVKSMVLEVVKAIKDVTEKIDMGKLKDTSFAFLHDLDEQYEIKSYLEETVVELKEMVEDFELARFIEDLKDFVIVDLKDFQEFRDFLVEEINEMIDYVKELFTEIDIMKGLNDYVREILAELEVDKLISVDELTKVIEQAVQVFTSIVQTVQNLVREVLNKPIRYMRGTEIKQMIEHLNDCIENFIKNVKSFDYNTFVEQANRKLENIAFDLNFLIMGLEIPQKLENAREFANYALSSVKGFMDFLKTEEVADLIDGILNPIETHLRDCAVLNGIRAFLEMLKDKLITIDMEGEIYIPEFYIPGFYNIEETTINFDDIEDYIRDILNYIISLTEVRMFDAEDYFGNLKLNFLPEFPVITLPEVKLEPISFPVISKFIDKHQFSDLKIPEFKLPAFPYELTMPCFGKLYGEVKVNTPIFTMRTTAEFYNSTDSPETPHFTASVNSQGTSEYEMLKYSLDSTARVAVPKMSRLIVAETLRITHSALGVDHQASVTLYGLSAQTLARTTVKVNTAPYSANILNTVHFALEDGMSANFKTVYDDKVNSPLLIKAIQHSHTHELTARQDGLNFVLNFKDEGKLFTLDPSDEMTYKEELSLNINPVKFTLTYFGDIDSVYFKFKETANAEAVALSHIDFKSHIAYSSDSGSSFLMDAAGKAHLREMKVELTLTHDTKLAGLLTANFYNYLNFIMHPTDVVLDFQNRANAKVSISELYLSAKMDLMNNYTMTLNRNMQRMSTVALARFDQVKYSHNFTFENNKAETGIYAAMNADADLQFLTIPFSFPSIPLDTPFVDFTTEEIKDINLFEHTGLKNLLTTTDQSIDVDAKIVYQKSKTPPIIELGLIYVPSLGNLISELSFKSSVFNLNTNAGLYGEDNLVIRFGGTSTSVFECLKAKLEGTSSLSTKSGLKLATTVVLENVHIKGTHNSIATMNTNNLEAALSTGTSGDINLLVLKAKVNHKLDADNKPLSIVVSTLKTEYTFDIPIIELVGNGDAENTLKFEGAFNFISAETTTKGKITGTFLDGGTLNGVLNNDESIYLNGDSLRSTLKTTGNANLNYGDLKLEFDVDESLALEGAVNRLYTLLKLSSNNEVSIGQFNTKGKHTAQATVDLGLLKSLEADVKVDLSQPSTFGNIGISEVLVVEFTVPKQKIDYISKIISPVYRMDVVANLNGNAPVFKGIFKSTTTSPAVFLQYDLDSSMSTKMDNDALTVEANAVLTHADFTMDISNVISMSDPNHTLIVDITSPTFTDVNVRYAVGRDGASASVSTPSAGFLGYQLQATNPSHMYARIYSRYASGPQNDIEILEIRAAPMGDEKMLLSATYNSDAPRDMFIGLKERLPAMLSSVTQFAEKSSMLDAFETLRNSILNFLNEAYNAASSHAPQLSQLSDLYKNVVVQYQTTTQTLLDDVIKFLTETRFVLPGMDEATLPEICRKICSDIGKVLKKFMIVFNEYLDQYFFPIFETISTVQLYLPYGEVITVKEIQDSVREILRGISDEITRMIQEPDSPDVYLEKLGKAYEDVIDKLKSVDIEDTAASLYISFIREFRRLEDKFETSVAYEQFIAVLEQYVVPFFETFNKLLTDVISSLSTQAETTVKVSDGKVEIEFPFPFVH
ncbi:apolipoprotein Bb, tandem duplicate 1 [Triplophysa rosa]|uniref:Apolipoprotein Bb n=1 Tax=Triplophysa rosa TaxID=992332 RepID=A0A9W7TIM3_TRIRA|nr:apolipoprotein Bb, tandem duplicate 1 [Triplophysa rosa]KAI7799465.1 putative apolipoprotein Bb [Triplophysa rosa]